MSPYRNLKGLNCSRHTQRQVGVDDRMKKLPLNVSIYSSQILAFIPSLAARQGDAVIGRRVRVGVSELAAIVIAIFTSRPESFSHRPRTEPTYGSTHTQKRCHTSHNPRRKSPRPQPCPHASAKANTAISPVHNLHPQTTPTVPSAPQDYASRTVAGAT
jgi:hypothetical protein